MMKELAVLILFWIRCVNGASPDIDCSKPGFLYPDPTNCSRYHSCDQGNIRTHHCQGTKVFSELLGACVGFNSFFDQCSQNRPTEYCALNPDDRDVKIPHPTECQHFYSCDRLDGPVYKQSCDYPQLFDYVERRCRPYNETFCGFNRAEEVEGCGYAKYQCWGQNCIPCFVNYPSCKGLSDGKQPYQNRHWSPYYVFCQDERMVKRSECTLGTVRFIFHRDRRECVSLYEVPEEAGGMPVSCRDLDTGLHVIKDGLAGVYMECPGEIIHYCQNEEYVFSDLTKACEQPV